MKTLIIMSIVLTMSLMPTQASAQLSEKLYQVTDDGNFQFIYWQHSDGPKASVHPITPRTFYLETKRQGLLPEGLSYAAFLRLSNERQQAMLEVSQKDVIEAMNGSSKDSIQSADSGMPGTAGSATSETVELKQADYQTTAEGTSFSNADTLANEMHSEREIPWIVKVLTYPSSELDRLAIPVDDNRIDCFANSADEREIPWIVRAILMPGDLNEEQEYRGDNLPNGNVEISIKREKLSILLNALMSQDDKIQKEYGRVYPGIDGKLYGASDAELDEIIQALLNMKDDLLVDSKPELNKIFNELETLALGE